VDGGNGTFGRRYRTRLIAGPWYSLRNFWLLRGVLLTRTHELLSTYYTSTHIFSLSGGSGVGWGKNWVPSRGVRVTQAGMDSDVLFVL